MKEICLVTHTEATHHVERKMGGWYDSPLTDKGRVDARACGLRLVDQGWSAVPIFTSDLKRTSQMAEVLADCFESPIRYDKRLGDGSHLTERDVRV
jgi:probable phosphoglycerate mutase